MKKIQLVAVLAALVMITTSCGVSKTTSSARVAEPKTNLLVADLDVQTSKVTGEYRFDAKKNAIVDVNALVQNAIYNALKPLKADVLVGVQSQVVQEVRGRKYFTVTVTGYPAFYRNFRQSAIKDVEFKEVDGIIFVVPKNEAGDPTGYQVVVPSDKAANVLDMNLMSLDKVVFSNAESMGDGEVTLLQADSKEEKKGGLFSSLKGKGKKAKKGLLK